MESIQLNGWDIIPINKKTYETFHKKFKGHGNLSVEGIYRIEDIDEGIAQRFATSMDWDNRKRYVNDLYETSKMGLKFSSALGLFEYTLNQMYRKMPEYLWISKVLTDKEKDQI